MSPLNDERRSAAEIFADGHPETLKALQEAQGAVVDAETRTMVLSGEPDPRLDDPEHCFSLGYSDGYEAGVEAERSRLLKLAEEMAIEGVPPGYDNYEPWQIWKLFAAKLASRAAEPEKPAEPLPSADRRRG